MVEEKNIYEKNTLGWLRERQKIKAKKYGFDNIDDWLKWKADPFNILERKYGKEFTDWARENNRKVSKYWIDAGCKTYKEYQEKCAKRRGFKDHAESKREWRYKTGRQLPKELNEDCATHFGEFTENLMIQTFEDPIKMPYGNPGFDWLCKNGDKIDNKSGCLGYCCHSDWTGWIFAIMHNHIADWFILSAWDNRDSLNPLHVWAFHRNDIVRERKFCEFEGFSIANTPEKLKKLEKWEVTNRLHKLKELCDKEKKGTG